MPSLIAKHQEKQTVTHLKKTYTVIQQAFLRAIDENGNVDTWNLNGDTEYDNTILQKLKPYIKITKDCSVIPCEVNKFDMVYLNGRVIESDVSTFNGLFLADGTAIRGGISYPACSNGDGYCGVLQLHTNINAKTWVLGRNWFQFIVLKDRIIPDYRSDEVFKTECNLNGTGMGCTAWVLYNENMDYLRCPEELSWNGQRKCK